MFDMDFKCKGVNWVGAVYQRFETMCQEVEDIMCQETAKYVENQVQNVGVSVKKFYAEVMHDLLPPCSLDPVKDNTMGFSLEKSADFGAYEKSKVPFEKDLMKENANSHKVLGKTTKDEVLPSIFESSKAGYKGDTAKEKPPPLDLSEVVTPAEKYSSEARSLSKTPGKNHSIPPSFLDAIKGEDFKISLEQDDGVGTDKVPSVLTGIIKKTQHVHRASEKTGPVAERSLQKRKIYRKPRPVNEENSTKEQPTPINVNEVAAPAGKDSSQVSSLTKIHLLPTSSQDPKGVDPKLSLEQNDEVGVYKNLGVVGDTINKKSSQMEVSNSNTPAFEGPRESASFSELPCDIREEACNVNMSIPSSLEPVVCNFHEEKGIAGSTARVEHIADNSGKHALTTSQTTSFIDSSCDGLEDHSECADLDAYMALLEAEITGRLDDSEVEGTDAGKQINETTQEFCNANLEESCVVVDTKEVAFVPHRPGKHRSYKKKIHDALASRLRSAKKREYEQLAILCRGIESQEEAESSSSSTVLDLNSRNSRTQDQQEFEWELL